MPETSYELIDLLETDLRAAKTAYLRGSGWKESCDFPGGVWLWTKTLSDGRIIGVSKEYAIHMQLSLDQEEPDA